MVQAVFKESIYAYVTGLWQWDYGQVLRIQGLSLPPAVEIHFSLREKVGESVTRVGTTKDGITEVAIPDSMLEGTVPAFTGDYSIYAYIYLTDADSGETVRRITMLVKGRPKPSDVIQPDPERDEIFREAIAQVNASAGRAEEAAEAARESENVAADYAKKTSADLTEMQHLAEAVRQVEENVAADKETVIELKSQAQKAADNALQSERNAGDYEAAAQDAQNSAERAAEQAGTYASQAEANMDAVEQAKVLVLQAGNKVAEDKTSVEQTVNNFTLTAGQAVSDVNSAGREQITLIRAEGNDTIQDVQAEGAAQIQDIQAVADEIKADREQITQNKEDIRVLQKEVSKDATGIIESAKGKTIFMTDSSGKPFADFKVYGHSTQESTSGAQLYNVDALGGIAIIEADEDGYYTLDLDNSQGANYAYKNFTISPSELIQPSTQYAVVAEVAEISGCELMVSSNGSGFTGQFADRVNINTKGVHITLITSTDDMSNANCMFRSYISVYAGGIGHCRFRLSVIKDINVTADTFKYEPYTGGKPSPNPDYLQGIVSAGQCMATGAQLFDISKIEDTFNGISGLIKNEDGSITITSSSNDSSVATNKKLSELCPEIQVGKTYILTADTTGTQKQIYLVGANIVWNFGVPKEMTKEMLESTFRFYASGSATTAVISNIMFNEGTTALPWEPYTGGKPGVVGDKINVSIGGKNLFCDFVKNKTYENGSTVIVNPDKSISVHKVSGDAIIFSEKLYFEPGIYTLSNGLDSGNKTYVQFSASFSTISLNKRTIQWGGGETKLWLYSGINTVGNVTLYPQLERGNVVTTYEPYRPPQTLTISAPNGLPGIPVTSGGNYTDADGQQWICDEIDFGRGVYVQRVYEYTFKGNEYHSDDYIESSNAIILYIPESVPSGIGNSVYNRNIVKCNYCTSYDIDFSNKTGRTFAFYTFSGLWKFENGEQLKQWLAGKYESGAPLVVQYILAAPIETSLSADELAAYKALHTNYPTTVIGNDANCYMEAEYVADTKNHITQNYIPRTAYTALEERVAALEANAINNV